MIKMINRFVGFITRAILGIFALVGGVFVIIYAMIWDTIREKILKKKPVESPCFEKVVSKEDMAISKPKNITR